MQPILAITHSRAPDRFSSYILEILDAEGVVCRDNIDRAETPLTPALLDGRDLVIVAHIPLSTEDQNLLRAYVGHGGRLIAFRPPLEMADMFGAKSAGSFIGEGYIALNPAHPLTRTIAASDLQFHGDGDLYEAGASCQALAHFAGTPGKPVRYPAIFWQEHGRGVAAAFAYDLAASTVLFHQGRQEQSSIGAMPDADRDLKYSPNDLFVRYLDERLKNIPQADIHQDILMAMLDRFLAPARPMPRLWHFPRAAPAVAFIDGDSDSMKASDLDKTIRIVEDAGGKYTLYLMTDDFPELPPEQMAALQARGHDFGPHLFCGRLPAPEKVRENMQKEMQGFLDRYHYAPVSQRGHSVVWAGWTEHAKFQREHGLRLDNNFCAGVGFQEGFLGGSGLPVRFMDEHGRIVDVYEQVTVSTDDGWLFDKCFLPAKTYDQAIQDSLRQIDEAADRFHTVYHPYFHPPCVGHIYSGWTQSTARWLEAVCRHVQARKLPFVNGREWVQFNDARRAARADITAWDPASGRMDLVVTLPDNAKGLTLLLPGMWNGRHADVASANPSIRAQPVTLDRRSYLAVIFENQPGREILAVTYA